MPMPRPGTICRRSSSGGARSSSTRTPTSPPNCWPSCRRSRRRRRPPPPTKRRGGCMNAARPAAGPEFAPAKVNLTLRVTGRRPDGYHLLDSLVVFADCGDRLSLSPAEDLSLTLAGPFGGALSAEPDNLVLRAARALAEAAGIPPRGALTLEKNLPLASGIGGGSADAAAALRLLARSWGLRTAEFDL